MGWTKSKKSSFKAGDRVTVPGGYGDGTITEFEDGCGGGELASVKLDSGRQEWVGVSRLKAAGPKKSTDKKADDYELYVRDVIRTSDGRLGLIKDFTYGGFLQPRSGQVAVSPVVVAGDAGGGRNAVTPPTSPTQGRLIDEMRRPPTSHRVSDDLSTCEVFKYNKSVSNS